MISDAQLRTLVEAIEPLMAELGFELVDIKSRSSNDKQILDIQIDKEGGINVEDCAKASRKISLILDVEDMFPFEYVLEVGSPGIFRELKKEKDFLRFLGDRVKVQYNTADQKTKKIIGLLKAYEAQTVIITDTQSEYRLNLQQIKKIQLYPEI